MPWTKEEKCSRHYLSRDKIIHISPKIDATH